MYGKQAIGFLIQLDIKNIKEDYPVIKSYKISNDKMMELWQIPWEELVVAMYDKGLDRLYGKPVNIVYNGDRDKRYIVTKVRKGYSYDFQRLHKLEKDEWFSMGSSEDDLPAEWEYLIEQESSKVYKSVDEAIQALKTEAEYKTYYAK